jgi:glycosyltransferase involved in cell wall biosynthesis/SAM-dependent methyltransferase
VSGVRKSEKMNAPYGDEFYQAMSEGSDRSAAVVVPLVIDLVRPSSVIDVGCGTGAWLSRFRERGVQDVMGVEFSEVIPHLAHLDPTHIRNMDLSQPFRLDRKFDLVVSLEVAEHLPEQSAAGFVQSLVRLGPIVLFSAAVPHQGGTHHLNEQWPSYWARHFADNAFSPLDCFRDRIWRNDRIDWWYRQNLLLFVRADLVPEYAAPESRTRPRAALDRLMPHAFRNTASKAELLRPECSLSVIVLSRNGAGRIEYCLQSIVQRKLADEIIVFVDRDTSDDTAEIARQFTQHVHPIETSGSIESVLPKMVSFCSSEYVLRIDDDELLGGDWDRSSLNALMRCNDLTHVIVSRRWLIPPGDFFIANEPWFPDLQARLFRKDPDLIRWPTLIHDPMTIKGRGLVLLDRWIDHYDLIVKSRPDRERKCEYYRSLRPEKHLSDFYLYEEKEIVAVPADAAGFKAAVENYIARCEGLPRQATIPYQPGSEIRFEAGGNGFAYTRSGWANPESWGTWTRGHRAELRLLLQHPFEGDALLSVESLAYVGVNHPTLQVRIFCGPDMVGEWPVEVAAATERCLRIPALVIARKPELILAFQFQNPASPAELGESDDQRLLGLGFRKLRLIPATLNSQFVSN